MAVYTSNDIFLKTIVSFLDTMSSFSVNRLDDNGNISGYLPVKVIYAHPENYITRLQSSQEIVKTSFILPTMAVMIKTFKYANDRKTSKTSRVYFNNNSYVYTPIPYDIEIDLSILSKTYFDLFQLMEQILLKFTPSLNLSINYLGTGNPPDSVPFTIQNINSTFPEDLNVGDQRLMTVDMTFLSRTNLYLPQNVDGQINEVILNTYSLDTYKKFLEYTITATQISGLNYED